MEELETKYKECRKKCRALESQLILSCSIIEWIEAIIDGEKVDDFALSFPIVREVYNLKEWRKEI